MGIEEVQKQTKGLNACSEFLREHVEHEKEEIIAGETYDVNQRWNDLQVLFYCSIQFYTVHSAKTSKKCKHG